MKRYARGTHPYYQYKRKHTLSLGEKKRRWPQVMAVLVVSSMASVVLVAGYLYSRPLPLLTPQKRELALATPQVPKIDWPATSQVAFGTVEQGVLASKPGQVVRPTASVAKLLTVLTILEAKPLKLGEQGPLIPITQSDINIFNDYYAKNGSLVPLAIGEQITQYQMLQGILLPSANNYADSLAVWAFGSLDKYRVAAQAMAKKLGMTQTTVGLDASGFSPTTTSTASDLTLLGIATIKQPVMAQIVKQAEVTLPVAGVKRNTNWLLGDDGVIGIKTGNTDEIGGVFVFAYEDHIDKDHTVTIVGAVQGEPTLFDAVLGARTFIKQIKPQFGVVTVVKKDQPLATYNAPWGGNVMAVAEREVSVATWLGVAVKPRVALETITSDLPERSSVGSVASNGISSKVVTTGKLTDPSWQWRIFGQ